MGISSNQQRIYFFTGHLRLTMFSGFFDGILDIFHWDIQPIKTISSNHGTSRVHWLDICWILVLHEFRQYVCFPLVI